MFIAPNYIEKSIVSEKSYKLLENGFYVFKVNAKLNKNQISTAIETLFGTKPLLVRTINVKPHNKHFKGRIGTVSGYKKAIVKMPESFKLAD